MCLETKMLERITSVISRRIYIYIYTSTYKFKRAFFRHDRRTAPKFGTHVWIQTRLALTKKIDQPHRMFVGGMIQAGGR